MSEIPRPGAWGHVRALAPFRSSLPAEYLILCVTFPDCRASNDSQSE